jgi:hypothetical protein
MLGLREGAYVYYKAFCILLAVHLHKACVIRCVSLGLEGVYCAVRSA